LGADLTLPADFHSDLAAALHSVVLASLRPAGEKQGHFVADLLEPAVQKTKELLANPPAWLGGEMRASVMSWYACAAGTLGEQRRANDWLDESIKAHWQLLSHWRRERVPLDWAMTQNNLGNALSALGGRESGTARLEEAVAACRAALLEYTRERAPLQWAMTQNNLGNALQTLGGRESGTTRLEEAVEAFRAALLERTRERVPLDWAMTQNNLGTALGALGGRESGTARLEEAVAAYRAALEVFKEAKADYYIDTASRNLARAEKLLADRRAKGR